MKFRILFYEYDSYTFCGGQQSLSILLKALDREKYDIRILCPFQGPFVEKLESIGIGVKIFKLNGDLGNWRKRISEYSIIGKVNLLVACFITTFRLWFYLKREKIHLVHCNNIRPLIYGGWAAKIARIPLIWHLRGDTKLGILGRLGYVLSDIVILVSRNLSLLFHNKYKLVTIYNAIDPNLFKRHHHLKIRGEFGIPPCKTVIVFIGNVIYEKGHTFFLEAISLLRDMGFNKFICLIVGDCYDIRFKEKLLHIIQEHQINDYVIFTGWRNDIPEILAASDLLVLPSLNEGLPRTILEGMASGKPVVATNIAGIPELVIDGETGILVPPRDSKALAQAIKAILSDKGKATKMGENGRKRIEQHFTIDKMASDFENVLDTCLQKGYKG